jgi:hypothetical protein
MRPQPIHSGQPNTFLDNEITSELNRETCVSLSNGLFCASFITLYLPDYVQVSTKPCGILML